MSNVNSESCALDANGALKPASAISWYNDVDDDAPMATISRAPTFLTASRSSSSLSQGTLNNYVCMMGSGAVPAGLVAGSRRSGRASKPSAKFVMPHQLFLQFQLRGRPPDFLWSLGGV
jgi:hypothetical protein